MSWDLVVVFFHLAAACGLSQCVWSCLVSSQVNVATSAQMCRSETTGKARYALQSKAESLGTCDVASLHALANGPLPGTEEADPFPQNGEWQRLWALAVTVPGKQLC